MNKDAIRYHLEENTNFSFVEHEDSFLVHTNQLPKETLREISACKAGIRNQDGDILIFDDSDSYF